MNDKAGGDFRGAEEWLARTKSEGRILNTQWSSIILKLALTAAGAAAELVVYSRREIHQVYPRTE